MKHFPLFFILAAVCVAVWAQDSCTSDLGKCAAGNAELAKAMENQDVAKACKLMTDTISCTKTALNNCEKSGSVPSGTLDMARQALETAEEQQMQLCKGGSGGSGGDSGGNSGMTVMNQTSVLLTVFTALTALITRRLL